MIRKLDSLSKTDRRQRLGRRTSASTNVNVRTGRPVASQHDERARFSEVLRSSDGTIRQPGRRARRTDVGGTRPSEREGAEDLRDDSVRRQSEGRPR